MVVYWEAVKLYFNDKGGNILLVEIIIHALQAPILSLQNDKPYQLVKKKYIMKIE